MEQGSTYICDVLVLCGIVNPIIWRVHHTVFLTKKPQNSILLSNRWTIQRNSRYASCWAIATVANSPATINRQEAGDREEDITWWQLVITRNEYSTECYYSYLNSRNFVIMSHSAVYILVTTVCSIASFLCSTFRFSILICGIWEYKFVYYINTFSVHYIQRCADYCTVK